MKHIALAFLALTLTACAGYKTPGVNKEPAKMSADTLCYRYDGNTDSPIGKEIARRGLDCTGILRDDPLMPGGRELDAAHRMGR